MKKQFKKNWPLFLLASLTLGLAPFNPPHLTGKIRWMLGGKAFSGENSMKFMDYFDVLLHGTPWILLIFSLIIVLIEKIKKN